MEKKQRHRDDVAFQDYTQDARKVYKRQLRELPPDLEAYEKEKLAAIEKAAANGDLEIVETEDGEMIAIDKNGSFYSTADSVGFTDNKPSRANVDRLVNDIRKAEEVRLKKRKERRGDEEADVTYINEKNKQFNQKLARFYNKVRYASTSESSFIKGTDNLAVHDRDPGQFRTGYYDLRWRDGNKSIIHSQLVSHGSWRKTTNPSNESATSLSSRMTRDPVFQRVTLRAHTCVTWRSTILEHRLSPRTCRQLLDLFCAHWSFDGLVLQSFHHCLAHNISLKWLFSHGSQET